MEVCFPRPSRLELELPPMAMHGYLKEPKSIYAINIITIIIRLVRIDLHSPLSKSYHNCAILGTIAWIG